MSYRSKFVKNPADTCCLSVLSVRSSQRLGGLTFSAGWAPSCSRAPSPHAWRRTGSVYRVVHIVYILSWYQYYYIFLWCKTRKTNTAVNCVDTYMYHRNSVDTYRSFRLSFPIVCSRELQFDDCQNSHLNQSLVLDLLNLVLDFWIKSTYHNLLWKTAFFLFIKRNFRDRN